MKRLGFIAAGAAVLLLIGCGGGGSDERENTRARVKSIDTALGSRSQFDPMQVLGKGAFGHGGMSDALNGFMGSNGLPSPGFAGDTYSRAKSVAKTRAEGGVYFDGYLRLWAKKTQTDTDTTTEIRYDFYVDEALTQPGGFVSSLQPKWNDWVYPVDDLSPNGGPIVPPIQQPTFPIVYRTTYQFTEGTLKGSNGLSENITNSDYSYDSRYENNYADGWKDKGNNHSDRDGSTWFARIDTPEGKYAEGAGSFRSGIGGSRLESSDGYKADYQFTSSGSGHGKIEGTDPGLPVTVSWDMSGNVLVKYADGTTESFQRNYGYPIPVDYGGGNTTAAGTGSGGGTIAE
ncbi:MAG: hypothetical protein QM758_07895 [Armatimonas sp.]